LEGTIDDLRTETADLDLERIAWDAQLRERLRNFDGDLLVLVAVPRADDAREFFESLRDHPLSIPTLALVPAEGGASLLQLASRAADDFIITPAYGGEFRHRVVRLVGGGTEDVDGVSERLAEEMMLAGLVGRNPAFIKTVDKIPIAAQVPTGQC